MRVRRRHHGQVTSHRQRPFRFGAVVAGPADGAGWTTTARRLEQLGYSTLLVPDTMATPSPFPALTAAAVATTTLRVGTWVLASAYRTVGQVTRDAVTVQRLSGDRLELGIGAGRPGGEHDAELLGMEWGTPGERVDRVERVLARLREQQDRPRLVVAGAGPRMLRLAGRYADTLALAVPPTAGAEQLDEVVGRVRAAAGERADALELNLQLSGVGSRLPEWVSQRMGLTAEDLLRRGAVTVVGDDPAEAAEQLRAMRERTGISYLSVSGEFADLLAPVVRELAGT